jgi:hypothetical protein
MREILNPRAMLVGLAILAATGLAACTVRPTSDVGAPRSGQRATSPAAIVAATPAVTPQGAQSSTKPAARALSRT